MTIGERIKELRREKGIKQSELAEALHISPSTIGMYEQNRRGIDSKTLISIAMYFQVSTDYLLGKKNRNKLSTARIAFKKDVQLLSDFLGISESEYIDMETTEFQHIDDRLEKLSAFYRLDANFLMGKDYKVTLPPSEWRVDLREDYYSADQNLKECLLCRYGKLQYIENQSSDLNTTKESLSLTEQEKTLLTVFRETTEEGRMEMIAAIINIKKAIEAKRSASSDSTFA